MSKCLEQSCQRSGQRSHECVLQAELASAQGLAVVPSEKISKILVTKLSNYQRKNSDFGIFNHEGGATSLFPGLVVETGFSDALKKTRREIYVCGSTSQTTKY
jgi:hypothetical protein